MCKDHVDTDVAPASPMAFLAASRQRALPRQDAEYVSVHSRCRCWVSLLPCFATERGAHVNYSSASRRRFRAFRHLQV